MLTHIESCAALVAVAIAFLQVFNPAATSCDLQKEIEFWDACNSIAENISCTESFVDKVVYFHTAFNFHRCRIKNTGILYKISKFVGN